MALVIGPLSLRVDGTRATAVEAAHSHNHAAASHHGSAQTADGFAIADQRQGDTHNDSVDVFDCHAICFSAMESRELPNTFANMYGGRRTFDLASFGLDSHAPDTHKRPPRNLV